MQLQGVRDFPLGMARNGRYSCETATQTLEWINAINDFLKPYRPLLNAHVVNFFKDRLWESVDKLWIDCLWKESVENLLKIPSGIVQVEILAAVVSSIARSSGAQTIIDVGAGQGYLAQVLSFQYQLSVVAIDASSHHGAVTSARSERIRKHYAAKMRKSHTGNMHLNVPQTVTCCVLSSDMLKSLSDTLTHKDDVEQLKLIGTGLDEPRLEGLGADGGKQTSTCHSPNMESSLVLAGLHACGDLSVTMLRTFLERKEVKAVVSIGCCYNLLSEEGFDNTSSNCGFPMSVGVKLAGLSLGKSARDLACQELIGPYWSLRAALGPLLETLLLLDRLLFLQEQGSSVEAVMLPIFDPTLSPRNVAIIAQRI
ncbi:hypothetical protein HHK36_004827 [Tetracentron sinense]|uniref:Methyltransferase domain-containing protein n=1 Tax=Tetracentron sinense TaxID=13715 RepID=A0A834ZK75_TETSI|nr:hypothetical protein HHK36_004827 [Tetracentron sinense]